jgi:hypothetical protein
VGIDLQGGRDKAEARREAERRAEEEEEARKEAAEAKRARLEKRAKQQAQASAGGLQPLTDELEEVLARTRTRTHARARLIHCPLLSSPSLRCGGSAWTRSVPTPASAASWRGV